MGAIYRQTDGRSQGDDNARCYRLGVSQTYREFVRRRRQILGLSQRELAGRSGLKQPLIAAIETGRRDPSAAARQALDQALELRPSVALEARRTEVGEIFRRRGLPQPKVFGSVARDVDETSSDLDLVVELSAEHDIVDLLDLEEELSTLLTVDVDVIDAGAQGSIEQPLHLAQFGGDAAYTVSLGREAYLTDTPQGRILRNSGRHVLIQVATVVEKLPAEFKDGHPEVDWVGIGRMRNLLAHSNDTAHHYDKVDDELVFRALASRIPALLATLGIPEG